MTFDHKKIMRIIQMLILSTFAVSSALGETLSEMEKLDKQRAEKIAEINANYIKLSEKLKLKFMKSGDLVSANKVQAKIDALNMPTNESDSNHLENSRWVWGSGGVLTLQKNGVARHTSWGHSSGKWKLYADGTMKITAGKSVFEVKFTDEMQGEVTHAKGGAKTTITRKK